MLTSDALSSAIVDVLTGPQVQCAVAFWGEGAEDLIATNRLHRAQIICNLASGATNPDVLEKLRDKGVAIRQYDQLHAKVYIGGDKAIVASANASINGLGLQGQEQAMWLEAGAPVDVSTARAWFKALWKVARSVEQVDLDRARLLFKRRRRSRPAQDFKSFINGANVLPLMSWVGNEKATYKIEDAVATFGGPIEVLERRIAKGIEVTGSEDRAIAPFTWCLQYRTTKSRVLPIPRRGAWWTCLAGPDAIAEKSVDYYARTEKHRRLQSVMMEVEYPPPEPFYLDPHFLDVFQQVLRKPKFRDITSTDFKRSFFTKGRKNLIAGAWKELRKLY